MDLGGRISKLLLLFAAVTLNFKASSSAHLIGAYPAVPPHAAIPVHGFPVFAAHTKLIPHPLPASTAILATGPHGTAAVIGPFPPGTIFAAPVGAHQPSPMFAHQPPPLFAHHVLPYNADPGAPITVPLKLFFTRFPPFIEAIVQRIQNYYSTYNHVGNEPYPSSSSSQNERASTTTTPIPTTAVSETSTLPQTSAGTSSTENDHGSSDRDNEERYSYDPPLSSPFRYPKDGFPKFASKDIIQPRHLL